MPRPRTVAAAIAFMVLACSEAGSVGPPPVRTWGPGLGPNAGLSGRRPFPDDNPWNLPVDQALIDPNSDSLIASIGLTAGLHPDFGASYNGGPFGIPYIVVDSTVPGVRVTFDYADESDSGRTRFRLTRRSRGALIPAATVMCSSSTATIGNCRSCSPRIPFREAWIGRRVQGRCSIFPRTPCGPRVGRLRMRRGFPFFPDWCATTKSWSRD